MAYMSRRIPGDGGVWFLGCSFDLFPNKLNQEAGFHVDEQALIGSQVHKASVYSKHVCLYKALVPISTFPCEAQTVYKRTQRTPAEFISAAGF